MGRSDISHQILMYDSLRHQIYASFVLPSIILSLSLCFYKFFLSFSEHISRSILRTLTLHIYLSFTASCLCNPSTFSLHLRLDICQCP